MTATLPTVPLLIQGEFVESATTQWRDVVNPATQEPLARVPFATADEINAAIASAKAAFKTWRKTPIGARARIFLKPQQLIRENMADLAATLTAEQGKTLADAEGDVFRGLEVVEHVYFPRRYAATLFALLEPGGTAIVSTPYHGYWKNLALALSGKMDAHFTALWDYGHIKFWSVATLTRLLAEAGFDDIRFQRVGRIPALAKSMIAIARRP